MVLVQADMTDEGQAIVALDRRSGRERRRTEPGNGDQAVRTVVAGDIVEIRDRRDDGTATWLEVRDLKSGGRLGRIDTRWQAPRR